VRVAEFPSIFFSKNLFLFNRDVRSSEALFKFDHGERISAYGLFIHAEEFIDQRHLLTDIRDFCWQDEEKYTEAIEDGLRSLPTTLEVCTGIDLCSTSL